MSLIRFDEVSLEFGDNPLLRSVEFSLEPNERVCLIGRNGAGKSSLLKLITGQITPDQGEIHYQQNLRISQLAQELPDELESTVFDIVKGGMAEQQRLLDQYNTLIQQDLDDEAVKDLENIQQQIDATGAWKIDQQVETIASQLELPLAKKLKELSGGWRRRVSLGRALVSKPDILLLDEPTNHLDISTIEWLEHEVRGFAGSVLFITHDRAFLQKLATRIVEIDRGKLLSWPGTYQQYLVAKEQALEDEDRQNALFDKKLAQEETWIRQGIKARRTRNEGRVRALKAMREEHGKRIKRQGSARIHVEEAEQSGRKVIEARNITHGYQGETLIKDFSIKIMRGDRIGLIGNNGVGKSTLLKILLGQIQPDAGSVKLGTNLEVGYFDQMRRELDPNKTIAETIGEGRDYIQLYGKDRHVIGYLRDFLFSAKRAMTPIKALSGGERNRVILAKIFTRPTNFLILDEPTNDLDVEMLEVLEQRLVDYQGTLMLVSHDRDFLDNVITSTLVFEEGRDASNVQYYVGGYSDWVKRGKALAQKEGPVAKTSVASASTATPKKSKKLSYKVQRELDELPGQIEQLEASIAALQLKVADPAFYQQPQHEVDAGLQSLQEQQQTLDTMMARWIELEA